MAGHMLSFPSIKAYCGHRSCNVADMAAPGIFLSIKAYCGSPSFNIADIGIVRPWLLLGFPFIP